jgi:uncharacterized protein (DUF488 family)
MSGTLFTIGFTRSTAEAFFGRLEGAGVRTVADVRLKPRSQLAGFAKPPDLAFFLRRLSGIGYVGAPLLAPAAAEFAAYRRGALSFDAYAGAYLARLRAQAVAARLDPGAFDHACLLCSEADAERCHRRFAAEHLADAWAGGWRIVHL